MVSKYLIHIYVIAIIFLATLLALDGTSELGQDGPIIFDGGQNANL